MAAIPPLVHRLDGDTFTDQSPGVRNYVYRGERLLLSRWDLAALDEEPEVRKPHVHEDLEQITVVLEGIVESHVGDRVEETPAGAVYHIPSGTPHKVQRINRDRVVILDIFSGVQGDFAIDFAARAMNRDDFNSDG